MYIIILCNEELNNFNCFFLMIHNSCLEGGISIKVMRSDEGKGEEELLDLKAIIQSSCTQHSVTLSSLLFIFLGIPRPGSPQSGSGCH